MFWKTGSSRDMVGLYGTKRTVDAGPMSLGWVARLAEFGAWGA